jgi:DNA-binding MarR family transcriptional regulator
MAGLRNGELQSAPPDDGKDIFDKLNPKGIFGIMNITNPLALRAMAHPLRLDLLEVLTVAGPATAATCARELGSTQASCSYHLRQLAKYGFVEQADQTEDARERPWRLTDLEQSWSASEGDPATEELERIFVQREADRILAWQATSRHQPEAWRDAGFLGGATVPMTADELSALRGQLLDLLKPYIDRLGDRGVWPADARLVRIFLTGTPAGTDPEGTDS